jgi:hypothetical protein
MAESGRPTDSSWAVVEESEIVAGYGAESTIVAYGIDLSKACIRSKVEFAGAVAE